MCYTADVCVANKMECIESILHYHVKKCNLEVVTSQLMSLNGFAGATVSVVFYERDLELEIFYDCVRLM
jgi:S-adenosylmethionine/arginine decarboxylase-like enzyme